MGVGDIIILALLAVAVGFALRAVRKGKGRCCGDCAQCARRCAETEKKDEETR